MLFSFQSNLSQSEEKKSFRTENLCSIKFRFIDLLKLLVFEIDSRQEISLQEAAFYRAINLLTVKISLAKKSSHGDPQSV